MIFGLILVLGVIFVFIGGQSAIFVAVPKRAYVNIRRRKAPTWTPPTSWWRGLQRFYPTIKTFVT